MIAWNIDHLGTVFGLFQYGLHNTIINFGPVPTSPGLEQIQNIANQIQVF